MFCIIIRRLQEVANLVGVAQLAERLTVAQEVQGSSPCTHPILEEHGPLAQLAEQGTLNPKVQGSNP